MLKKKSKAFTLAELLVAVTILGTSLGALIYSYMAFLNLSHFAKNVSLAGRVASAKLEDIKSDSFDDVNDYANQIFYASNTPNPQDIDFQDFDYRGIVYVDDVSANLKKVTVVMCWKQGQRTVGSDWAFIPNEDPAAHGAPAASPVTLVTYMSKH